MKRSTSPTAATAPAAPRRAQRNWTRALVAGIAVVLLLPLAACNSETVREANQRSEAEQGSQGPQTQLIPDGDIVAASRQMVQESLAGRTGFEPPASGPSAQQEGATIAFVGSDLSNGGINAVATGVQEAAKAIGWTVNVYDGQASAQGRSNAMNQAIAAGPAAIVIGGFDTKEQASSIKRATDAGIPVVGWHAKAAAGPGDGLFTNITTDPIKVSQLAAAYAVADSGGTAGVAIFTDGQYEIAVQKADAMRQYIEACAECSVLSYEDSPIAEADQRMPGLISTLLQNNGDRLTYLLGINGNYFGGAQQALRAAGKPAGGPPKSVAAGDGDPAEFQRIRTGNYQAATVAEPLYLQGWQIVDEINRALAGEGPSDFIASPGLITQQNAPSGDVFDPDSGYREVYRGVWGR